MFEVCEFSGHLEKSGPNLLITGGIHGDEFESIAAIQRLISYFSGDDGPDFAGKLTLIPIANEDAFRCGNRVGGEDGLDLARTFPGREDGSRTEKVAHLLNERIAAADCYIDLHTGGTELSVLPLSGYVLHENEEILETQRRMAKAMNLPFIWGTAADLDGRSMSAARDAGVPAIYCEYLGSATCSADGVDAYFEGCLNVMAEMGMLPDHSWTALDHEIVEDPAPGSGHMQVSHPAPCEGYFHAEIELGQRVEKGESLGRISDFTGGNSVSISANQSGKVIVLRTFPRVREGDPIAVIA